MFNASNICGVKFSGNRRMKEYFGKLDTISSILMILFVASLLVTWVYILTCKISGSNNNYFDVDCCVGANFVCIKC